MRKKRFYLIAAVLFLLALLAYSYFIEPHRLVVHKKEINLATLDPAFDGLRIAVIADIHGGSNGASADNIRRTVSTINEQNADAVFMIGDFVSDRIAKGDVPMHIEEVAEYLRPITSRYGTFAVLGNHDGFYGDDRIEAALSNSGIKVLRSEIASFQYNGKTMRILGLKDHMQLNSWYTFDRDVKRILAADGRRGDLIVLEHSPDIFDVVDYYKNPGEDMKLFIAGHTHGGQIWLPVIGSPFVPTAAGQKYSAGHIRKGKMDMFITTGIGTSRLPFRFLVPPEVAVLTLRSGLK